jgi:hypothetical protein
MVMKYGDDGKSLDVMDFRWVRMEKGKQTLLYLMGRLRVTMTIFVISRG